MHGGGLPGALLMRGGGGEWGRCWERTPSKQAAARLPGNLRVCNRQHNFPLHLWFRGSLLAVLQDTQLLQESMYRLAQDRTGRQLSPSSLSGKFRLEILTSGLQVHLEMKPVESPRQENLSSSETVGFKSPRGIVWWRPSSILAKQL